MTATTQPGDLRFALDPAHEAHEPPEARGLRRDGVRLLVTRGDAEPIDTRFTELGSFLCPGDLLVVNTSATIPAALDGRLPGGEPIVVHLSGPLPGDVWLVEARQPHGGSTSPLRLDRAVDVELLGGGSVRLLTPFSDSTRLWLARLDLGLAVSDYADRHGRPRPRTSPTTGRSAATRPSSRGSPGAPRCPSPAVPSAPKS